MYGDAFCDVSNGITREVKLFLKDDLFDTWARLFIAWLELFPSLFAVLPTIGRGRVGAGSWSFLCSTATRSRAYAPDSPWCQPSRNCVSTKIQDRQTLNWTFKILTKYPHRRLMLSFSSIVIYWRMNPSGEALTSVKNFIPSFRRSTASSRIQFFVWNSFSDDACRRSAKAQRVKFQAAAQGLAWAVSYSTLQSANLKKKHSS